MKPEETERCAPSRDIISTFLNIQIRNQIKLPEQEKELLDAFMHIEMCYHGYDRINPCHQLWHKIQGLINTANPNYDSQVALYYMEAKRTLHAAMNPQQEPGIDY